MYGSTALTLANLEASMKQCTIKLITDEKQESEGED